MISAEPYCLQGPSCTPTQAAAIHIARVIQDLGIAEKLKPKIKFGVGGDITEVTVMQGEGALGMTQVSEIIDTARGSQAD